MRVGLADEIGDDDLFAGAQPTDGIGDGSSRCVMAVAKGRCENKDQNSQGLDGRTKKFKKTR